jgi:general secretion pathway protein J
MKAVAGFTLLETLVALVVLSLIVLGLAQGLRFGLLAWDHQAMAIDRAGSLDTTDRTLRQLIAGMIPGNDPRIPAVLGTPTELRFTAVMPRMTPVGPVRLADVALRVDSMNRLILRWSPHLHAKLLSQPPIHEEVVLAGVRGLAVSYFQQATTKQPAGWVDRWQSADPPELVRIHFILADKQKHWPDIIVANMNERDAQ